MIANSSMLFRGWACHQGYDYFPTTKLQPNFGGLFGLKINQPEIFMEISTKSKDFDSALAMRISM